MSTRDIGASGEVIAEAYLVRNNYTIQTKNWTVPGGELDIVAEKNGIVIFVEVKFRTSTRLGHSRESLGALKKRYFRRSGMLYATKHGLHEEQIRFDFIAIQKNSSGYHLEHFCNIEV